MLTGVSDKDLKREFLVWIHRMLQRKKVSLDLSLASEEEVTHMLMESIEKLKQEGRQETALKMKELGYDTDAIAQVTGLSQPEIGKL